MADTKGTQGTGAVISVPQFTIPVFNSTGATSTSIEANLEQAGIIVSEDKPEEAAEAKQARINRWQLLLDNERAQESARIATEAAQNDDIIFQQQLLQQLLRLCTNVQKDAAQLTAEVQQKISDVTVLNSQLDEAVKVVAEKVETNPQAIMANKFLERAQKQVENFETTQAKTIERLQNQIQQLDEKIAENPSSPELQAKQEKYIKALEAVEAGQAHLDIRSLLRDSGYRADDLLESLKNNEQLRSYFSKDDLGILQNLLKDTNHHLILSNEGMEQTHLKDADYARRTVEMQYSAAEDRKRLGQLNNAKQQVAQTLENAAAHPAPDFAAHIANPEVSFNQLQDGVNALQQAMDQFRQQNAGLLNLNVASIIDLVQGKPKPDAPQPTIITAQTSTKYATKPTVG
ncbi:MAG: hypothetical protein ACOYK8_10615 [Alphaproteobacteria bacterium]